MRTTETDLPGVRLVEPAVHADARGEFVESWQRERYAAAGIDAEFTQDNVSVSRAGVLRGLHLQGGDRGQAKLVSVVRGAVFDVAVDVRRGSPHFGRWTGHELSATNHRQLFIPPGFAHGFAVVGDGAVVVYKVAGPRDVAAEVAIAWDDPALAIAWPVVAPVVSERDRVAPRLRDLAEERLPLYGATAAAAR